MASKDQVIDIAKSFKVPVEDGDTEQDILDRIKQWSPQLVPSNRTSNAQWIAIAVALFSALAAWTSAYWGMKSAETAITNLKNSFDQFNRDSERQNKALEADRQRDAQKLIVLDILLNSSIKMQPLTIEQIREKYTLETEKYPAITEPKTIDTPVLKKILIDLSSHSLIYVIYPNNKEDGPTYTAYSRAYDKNAHRAFVLEEARSELLDRVFNASDGVGLKDVEREFKDKFKLTSVEWSSLICSLVNTHKLVIDMKQRLFIRPCGIPLVAPDMPKEEPKPKISRLPLPLGPKESGLD